MYGGQCGEKFRSQGGICDSLGSPESWIWIHKMICELILSNMLGVDSFIDLSEFNTWVNWYMALFEEFCGVFCEWWEVIGE